MRHQEPQIHWEEIHLKGSKTEGEALILVSKIWAQIQFGQCWLCGPGQVCCLDLIALLCTMGLTTATLSFEGNKVQEAPGPRALPSTPN